MVNVRDIGDSWYYYYYPVVSKILFMDLQRAISVTHFGFPVSPYSAYMTHCEELSGATLFKCTFRILRGL